MGSQQSTVDFVLDQMSAAGAVSAKKMFGEYGVYLDEKMVALVCDDVLFIKPCSRLVIHVFAARRVGSDPLESSQTGSAQDPAGFAQLSAQLK
ncbi:MAG: hypothetical protein EOO77_23380 [Oxalobacteraceae bacterium]|nr:MAG: hypothetical protein EOO77_23380 [Oxalobacteraceae bacterium]